MLNKHIVCYVDIRALSAYSQAVKSETLYKRIGELIKRRRKRLGMTQEKLAGQLGISRASLANIETGRQNVLVHHLYKLAEALDLEVSALLPVSSSPSAANDGLDLPLPENLNTLQRAQVMRMLRDDSDEPSQTKGEPRAPRTKSRS